MNPSTSNDTGETGAVESASGRAASEGTGRRPRFGAVVLTQGKRPGDLDRGLRSLLDQHGVDLDITVVGNGWDPTGLPEGVRAHGLPENLGIPAGRNAGVPLVDGDYLFFLDDDAWLPDPEFLLRVAALFAERPEIGLVQAQVRDPDAEASPRRWIPRLRKGDPNRPSPVFSVWEGAVALRPEAFWAAGGWPDEFFYAHEGIELAWRVWDAGYEVWYAGDLTVNHPAINPARHAYYYRLNARNRVWLARRNLPAVLIPAYVGTWTAVQVVRSRHDREALSAWFSGWREGWKSDPGDRRPLRWSTVLEMSRHGRPPVV